MWTGFFYGLAKLILGGTATLQLQVTFRVVGEYVVLKRL
jgi:hypothetical protein